MLKLIFSFVASLSLLSLSDLIGCRRLASQQIKIDNFIKRDNIFQRGLHKSAFTLVEVIIGVAILSIVMASITVLTIVSIQANQANVNRLTGYYLAQEGLEGLRNMRDSNWLQNYGWARNAGWGIDFESDGYYTVDYQPHATQPWVLSQVTDTTVGTELTLVKDSSEKVFYVHDVDISWTELSSKFNRYIEVTHVSEGILQATAVVFWDDHGRTIEVEVSTELTDWREGPI